MSHTGRQSSITYGIYISVLTVVFAAYQQFYTPVQLQSYSNPRHPIVEVCASRYSPNTLAFNTIVKAVDDAAVLYGVSPQLISAVIAIESKCHIAARSPRGAVGLMQLMPKTAKHLGVKDPYSIRENIFGGTKYLAKLLKDWDGNKELALAAYNAGPTRVRQFKSIPPIKETQHYVKKVLHTYRGLELRGYSKT